MMQAGGQGNYGAVIPILNQIPETLKYFDFYYSQPFIQRTQEVLKQYDWTKVRKVGIISTVCAYDVAKYVHQQDCSIEYVYYHPAVHQTMNLFTSLQQGMQLRYRNYFTETLPFLKYCDVIILPDNEYLAPITLFPWYETIKGKDIIAINHFKMYSQWEHSLKIYHPENIETWLHDFGPVEIQTSKAVSINIHRTERSYKTMHYSLIGKLA